VGFNNRVTDEETIALVRACRSARDRLIVLLMWRLQGAASREGSA